MSNAKIYDCKGDFFDSDNGIKKGDYAHNEDLIFTICVKNASSITLVFTSFCTEKTEDYLIIYDGADTTAKKLSGKISGTTNPGSFSSSDSCLTLYYHTDKSVACDGWEGYWTTKVKPLLDPKFISPPKANCDAKGIAFKFDQKFNCDSINVSNFSLNGILNPGITSITPIGCDANRETDSFLVNLSTALNRSGKYNFTFDAVKYDECDSAWQLQADTFFFITDCPIYVELSADPDTICSGTCSKITAIVTGGDSTKYNFKWTPNISGTFGPNNFCPTASVWLKLEVSDGTSVPGVDSIFIEVVNPPVAQKDTTVCQSNPAFLLTASPTGGSWSGKGIINSKTGEYMPQQAGPGNDTVRYSYAGCSDDVVITVRAMDAGPPNASCPGASAFNVTGFSPAGGVWSGTNIQANGLFDPKDTGTYTVTYTWNGCVDTKQINVYPISTQDFDTTCQSTPSVNLQFSPVGGTWSGPGFVNNTDGIFYPSTSGSGIKTLIYSINGCKDTTKMNVISINARGNQIACPDAPPFDVYAGLPVNGYWTGIGITDSAKGTYDASFIYGINRTWYNDTLKYFVNGCEDEKIMYVRKVSIGFDTLKFCIEDDSILLNYANTRISVGGGIWSGPGILKNYFNPLRAGSGVHRAYYDAYGCSDSLIFWVYAPVKIQSDTTVCVTDNAFILVNDSLGGTWQGNGIANQTTGLFNPSLAKVGQHKVMHISPNGCLDSLFVEVEAKPVVKLSGYDPVYCFRDSLFTILGTPAGGNLSGLGIEGNGFRPKTAGTGFHQLKYQFGTPTCFSADSVVVQVLDTLQGDILVDDDSLCDGEKVLLFATASKGKGGGYIYRWTDGTASRTLLTRPATTSWVNCTFSDGCSDLVADSVLIHVFPKIEVGASSSDTQCYGTIGFAEVLPLFKDPAEITWFTTPIKQTNRIVAPVGNSYRFRITNKLTGCQLDSSVFVLSYPRIKAHFITTPSQGHCLDPFDPILYVIDFTSGATKGSWNFGDGKIIPYQSGLNPSNVYAADTNWYKIILQVENEGGCLDSAFGEVCLDDSVYVMVPTAFSPGNDGHNDTYRIAMANVNELYVEIFNRWGERVFESRDINFEWDGFYKGKPIDKGVYSYKVDYKGKNSVRKTTFGTLHVLK